MRIFRIRPKAVWYQVCYISLLKTFGFCFSDLFVKSLSTSKARVNITEHIEAKVTMLKFHCVYWKKIVLLLFCKKVRKFMCSAKCLVCKQNLHFFSDNNRYVRPYFLSNVSQFGKSSVWEREKSISKTQNVNGRNFKQISFLTAKGFYL